MTRDRNSNQGRSRATVAHAGRGSAFRVSKARPRVPVKFQHVVPSHSHCFVRARLQRLRKNSFAGEFCIRARLQSCRNCRKMNEGFSPCAMLAFRTRVFPQSPSRLMSSAYPVTWSGPPGTPPCRSAFSHRLRPLAPADRFQSWDARRLVRQSAACLQNRQACRPPSPAAIGCR